MAVKSDGSLVRVKKAKKSTATNKNHRYESFNQRISKIKIDPIRKSTREAVDAEDSSIATSHFRSGLEYWKDVNLSQNFGAFAREVAPVCDGLPQILLYQDRLLETVLRYVEKQDTLSMEPLLSLLQHLAHDLGAQFERHFPRALTAITTVASQHQDVEVIEWVFSSVAWLFKFFSKLLVPNIAPTYDILAPLLGGQARKPYLTRFTAEALSCLIRKAALLYPRDQQPLADIIRHIFEEASHEPFAQLSDLHSYGVMNMLMEAMRGVDQGFHSCACPLLQCLLACAKRNSDISVVLGALSASIHHGNPQSFEPLLDSILRFVSDVQRTGNGKISFCLQLFFHVSTAHRGSRVADWHPVISTFSSLLEHVQFSEPSEESDAMRLLVKTAAAVFASAPVGAITPHLKTIMEILTLEPHYPRFLAFCTVLGDLNRGRFNELIYPYFYKYLTMHWESKESTLLSVLPMMLSPRDGSAKPPIVSKQCPRAWQDRIAESFETPEFGSTSLHRRASYLDLLNILSFDEDAIARIMHNLSSRLLSLVGKDGQDSKGLSPEEMFLLGPVLETLLVSSFGNEIVPAWDQLLTLLQKYPSWLPLLQNAVHFSLGNPAASRIFPPDSLVESIISNLSSSSRDLRKLSLRLLDWAHRQTSVKFDVLKLALAIEELPLDVQSARQGSMLIRRLADRYRSFSTDHLVAKAVPHFCLGLLTLNFAPWWDDAVEVLKVISAYPTGEATIVDVIFNWLDEDPSRGNTATKKIADLKRQHLTEFHSADALAVEDVVQERLGEVQNAEKTLEKRFETRVQSPANNWNNARSQSLKVLNGIPKLAEKKSRRLVPYLLDWASHKPGGALNAGLQSTNDSTAPGREGTKDKPNTWSRLDGQALLDLFGHFVNPRTLYKSSDVFESLLHCLSKGDVEIQKSAFKAIQTWKIDALRRYETNILNIIDESRFRDELTTFLCADGGSAVLQAEHHKDVMPVLLRTLCGKALTRNTASSNRSGPMARRKAVFDALFPLPDEYIKYFLGVALEPLERVSLSDPEAWQDDQSGNPGVPPHVSLGIVDFLKDFITSMGDRIAFVGERVFSAALYCSVKADELLSPASNDAIMHASLLKDVRQTGLRCVTLAFEHFDVDDLERFIPVLSRKLIGPKLEAFPTEAAHSISALLRLFAVWASSPRTAIFLASCHPALPAIIVDILNVPTAKDEVMVFVIEQILKPIAVAANTDADPNPLAQEVRDHVLRPNTSKMLQSAGLLLAQNPSVAVLTATLDLVTRLANLAEVSHPSLDLLEVAASLLQQPSRRVSPRSKGYVLDIIRRFLPQSGVKPEDGLFRQLFRSTSSLFGYFNDKENRTRLGETVQAMVSIDQTLRDTAELCFDMNSFLALVVDEPDYDRRIKAFNTAAEILPTCTQEQWRPLLYNCFFFVKHDDTALRSSASFALHGLIDSAASSSPGSSPDSELINTALLGEIRSGASHFSEPIRAEYLSMMAHLVKAFPKWLEVGDMHPLLMNGDEEASIFNNILHIQQHRRLRAMRRLAAETDKNGLSAKNITTFWIPLLEAFVLLKAEGSAEHNLASESISTISALVRAINWPQLKAMLRRYSGFVQSRRDIEKMVLKMLASLIESLSRVAPSQANADAPESQLSEVGNVPSSETMQPNRLGSTLPSSEKLSVEVEDSLLRSLLAYLHEKDESTVSLRAPVAVVVVKLLKLLPTEKVEQYLPRVLTDLCHILRSRAQDFRDLTRRSLAEISQLIGAERFSFVLHELRAALRYGYQRHVLSFTVHSLLVATASDFRPGDLDYCLPEIVSVVMGDIFGAVGQEKDAEDYVSKMKEVKSSKSFDSMELIASVTSIDQISPLVRPVQRMLEDRMDAKTIRKIDELLRRMGVGLLRNQSINDRSTLIFCYEILEQAQGSEAAEQRLDRGPNSNRYLVNVTGAKKTFSIRNRSACAYKLVCFSLDLLRSVLQRFEDLQTPSNVSGFLPVVGELLLGAQEEVQISALRLLATILRVPLKDIKSNAILYVREAVKIIKNAVSTSSEISQAALKLVTTILRERQEVEIKETDLAYLLKRVQSDLEEPDRQGITFNFLKAVLQRKIVITELYGIMDAVAAAMITGHAENTRNQARSLYFQFLLNFPQARNRFSKQLAFLVKNLEYKHAEGRQSVLEAIFLLLGRVGDDVAQDIVATFFLPLVIVTINDETPDCRKMAGSLLKSLFERADEERSRHLLKLLRGWLDQDQPLMVQMSFQVHSILLDVDSETLRKQVPLLHERVGQALQSVSAEPLLEEWELIYYGLKIITKLCDICPLETLGPERSSLWSSVQECLRFPHQWVKIAASELLGRYFAEIAKANADPGTVEFPLKNTFGLLLSTSELAKIVKMSFNAFRVPGVSKELSTQLVRLLIFSGRFGETQLVEQDPGDAEAGFEDAGDSSDEDAPAASTSRKPYRSMLRYILDRTSFTLRREPRTTRAESLIPRTAALQLLAALCNHVPAATLSPLLSTILRPLHHLTDPSVSAPFSLDEGFKEAQGNIVSTAHEILVLLQNRMGTKSYVEELNKVRERVKEKREGRRAKRKIEAVTRPEKLGREKRKKAERHKENRKERNKAYKDRRKAR